MRSNWILSAAMAVVVLNLSACELIEHRKTAEEGFERWSLLAEGERFGRLEVNQDKLRKILQEVLDIDVGSEEGRRALAKIIAKFDEGDVSTSDVPQALWGVSGSSTLALARLGIGEKQIISGKIRDYIYDDSKKSGHLAVETKVETFKTIANFSRRVPDRVEYFHWDIEVEGIYQVQTYSGDPFDPFPGTVQFPPEALGPEGSIQKRGLDHKLWAKGKGIVVRHVYRQVGAGPLERLPAGHPYYETTEESCIDLLFKGFPPARELPPQESYCLGRCDQPQVVNTK